MAQRQDFAQRHLGLVGGLARDQAPSIRNAMHVGIDTDARLAKRLRHHQVGGLAPHAVERHQVIYIVGYAAAEFIDEVAADAANHARLGAIEPDRVDELLQRLGRECEHLFGRARRGEQLLACDRGHLILGAQAQDASDEGEERALILLRGEGDDRRIPLRRLPGEDAEQLRHRLAGNARHNLAPRISNALNLRRNAIHSRGTSIMMWNRLQQVCFSN